MKSDKKSKKRQEDYIVVNSRLVALLFSSLAIIFILFVMIKHMAPEKTYMFCFVFVAGLIGGFISIQQRLPKIKPEELHLLAQSWLSMILVPFNGGFFALLLMIMFQAEIITGALFPKFNHPPLIQGEFTDPELLVKSFTNWLNFVMPVSGQDVAKLIFWSFVAGFSERFVPRIIKNVADQNLPNQDAKPDIKPQQTGNLAKKESSPKTAGSLDD